LQTGLGDDADSFAALKDELALSISPDPGEYPRPMGLVRIVTSIFNDIRTNFPICFF
jgi:hypothetical protein